VAAHQRVHSARSDVDSLALAMTASSTMPLLLLDGDLSVIAASDSFCSAFEIDPSNVRGRRYSELGTGEWSVAQVDVLLSATALGHAAIDAYEMDLIRKDREPRQLVLNAHKLDYADVRLLLAVTDVTDARASDKLKDDLVREKAILLQELQHRVANSLQIIASVLMQSARRVQSDETRGYLHDAHNRVMSIAALQRLLSTSTLGNVVMRSYLGDLCRSIGASMIPDRGQVSLTTNVDDSVLGPNASVSVGLIVTELVINALKHAFPDRRHGKIEVSYHSKDGAWTLVVADDGVGIHKDPSVAKPGLGTSIVQALATQLGATVEVAAADPGTVVSIHHRG
jgi:two-component sensor histidine kinase